MTAAATVAVAPAANAAVPGSWQKCQSTWSPSKLKVLSYYAWADGRTASINLTSDYGASFKVVTSAYDSSGRYLWVVDSRTFSTEGYKKWTMTGTARTGWTLSAKVTAVIDRVGDASCTARDKV